MGKNLYEKQQGVRDLAVKYGIDLDSYADDGNHRTGIGGAEWNQLQRDVAQAASNDYDLRETISAAAASGKKKAIEIEKEGWNYKDLSNVHKALNFQKKAAKRHGQGGTFSTTSDAMGLTRSMQDRAEKKQTEAYDQRYAKTTDLNDLKDKLMAEATEKAPNSNPIEPSDRLAAAESRLEAAASNSPPSLYSKNNTDPAKADDQKDAARNFLDDYKLDVAKGAGIKQDIARGVGNAAAFVSNIYGR